MTYMDCPTANSNQIFVDNAFIRVAVKTAVIRPESLFFGGYQRQLSESNDFQDIVKKWASSFSELQEAQNRDNYNAEVELPSDDTVSLVTYWLNEAFAVAPHLDAPEIMPDAKGGLDIEWYLNDKFVSIHIDHSSKVLNRIFIKEGAKSYSEDLTKENLNQVLSA